MKKILNLGLLFILLILTGAIIIKRFEGARPTQSSNTFIILILILNGLWILWNVRSQVWRGSLTRMGKN